MMNAPYRWSGFAEVPMVGLVEFGPITNEGLRAFIAWFEQNAVALEVAWMRYFQDMDWGGFVRACYGYPEQMRLTAQERVARAGLEGQFGGAVATHVYPAYYPQPAYYPVPVPTYRPRRPHHRPPPPPPSPTASPTSQAPPTTRTRSPQTNTRPSSGTNQRPSGGTRPTGGRR